MVKVKTNKVPENNILNAKLMVSPFRLDMPNRFTGRIGTGVEVQVPSTHCLCTALVPALSNKGLVMTNSGRFTSGEVCVHVLNGGREIVSVKDGDPLLEMWLEKVEKFIWETA